MIRVILFFWLMVVTSISFADSVDCNNPSINALVDNTNGTIVIITADCAPPQKHLCLDPNAKNMNARMLAHFISNKPFARISFDTTNIVGLCGFPMVTELR